MMRRRTIAAAALLALAALAATGLAQGPAGAAVTIQRMNYKGWPDSIRLTNGTAEAVVVPQVARIMRYGYVGGPNLFWEGAGAADGSKKIGEWVNYGGEKAWPWPQDDWGTRTKGAYGGWPPPTDVDPGPYAARTMGKDTVRLTSPVIKGYGLRIVRDVTLAPEGTRLSVKTRFEQVEGDAALPVAPWTVAQVPYADTPYLLRQVSGTFLAQGMRMEEKRSGEWTLGPRYGNVFTVSHGTDKANKAFFDADVIGAVYGDTLLSVRVDTRRIPPAEYVPGDRAQVYQNDKGTPYAEFEFTAPLKTLKRGESSELVTVYTLQRLPEGKRTAEAAAPLLGGGE